MSEPTPKGNNIAGQIQNEDVYGETDDLTLADVWIIIDNIHTHFMDTNRDTTFLEKWMRELEGMDGDLPAI